MIKLFLYIIILIGFAYVLDFFWQKWIISLRELKQAYKELKEAEQDLKDLLK